MLRIYVCLAVFLSISAVSTAALAESAAKPLTAVPRTPNWITTPTAGGFYIALPAFEPAQLVSRVSAYRASLNHRGEELTHYLDEHRLTAKDTLLTVILPGGLLYAAIRTGELEQAKAELADVTDDADDLARDLLALQAFAGDLTVARVE